MLCAVSMLAFARFQISPDAMMFLTQIGEEANSLDEPSCSSANACINSAQALFPLVSLVSFGSQPKFLTRAKVKSVTGTRCEAASLLKPSWRKPRAWLENVGECFECNGLQ